MVDVSWHGVAGDRRWAFVRPGQQANGFPWQTLLEQPQMCRFTAGDAVIRCDRRDPRCVIVNVDPDSARTDPKLLRLVAAERQSCAGVYASVVEPGRMAVDDEVRLIEQS